jgi:hypothetical protein
MDKNELEKKLNNSDWGFLKNTNSNDYLGWILIHKYKPLMIYPKEAYDNEEQYIRLTQEDKRRKKYMYYVRIIELRRDIHESGAYETGDDYRQNDCYHFSTLDEVKQFIVELGYRLEDLKDRWELDAP